ncbi:MAG: hypothetical protein ABI200_00820 [Gaiellales bacterium]
MSASFASQAWIDQLNEGLQSAAAVRTESMSWIFGPLLFVVDADEEHGLERTGIRIDLHEGSIRAVELTDGSEEQRVPFAIGGGLARWKATFSTGASIVDQILGSKLRVRGDLPTLGRHRALLAAITSAGGAIETSWQDDQEPANAQA